MRLDFPSPEFDDAVAAVCHGTADDAELRALNELLRGDPVARDEYLLRIELHARLASDRDIYSQPQDLVPACRTPVINFGDRRVRSARNPVAPALRRRAAQALALAAGLALVATGVWSFWLKQPAKWNRTTNRAVAVLTRAVDAHWDENSALVRVGGALEPGWLRLQSGLAQVVFHSGARVVIEGPAELQLVSPTEAICPTGRLLAEVPEPARGFRLKTDQLNVVDLGTAFGVEATRDRTEVHVFKGKVDLLPETAARQSLGEGQAALARGHTAPQLIPASTATFVSLFEFQERSLAAEAFRYEQWQLANARLNQDPSLVVHLEFQDLGTSDWTLRNTAEGNRSVPDATIVGCQRAEGRWREKQALEFHHVNDRLRLAVPGEFRALTLSAWVCVKGLDREFNSLFMCDGFDPGTVHWLIRNDGVLGLTVFGPEWGKFQILASPPVITREKLGMWTHLAVVVNGRTKQVVHYVNGSPVARQALELAPPFRIGPAELGNWNAKNGSNLAPGLIRNLRGALDEFELFNRALSDAEVRELHAKGNSDSNLEAQATR